MARELAGEQAAAEQAPAENVSTETTSTEAASTETTGEGQPAEGQPAEGTESADGDAAKPEEPKGPSQAELFTAFEESVAAALAHEGRDEATGTLPEEAIGPVKLAYAPLNPNNKTKARDLLQTRMTAHMTGTEEGIEQDYQMAKSVLDLLNNLKTQPQRAAAITKEPVDPTEDHVARVVAYVFAANFLPVPEGVKPDWNDKVNAKIQELQGQVQEYRTWIHENAGKEEADRTKAPEVSPIVLTAVGIANGRSAGTRTRKPKGEGGAPRAPRPSDGVRRDIGAHISSAFANVAAGTFLTIGEIVNHKSEEYGDEKPSQGAIAARLFPKSGNCTIEGIRPEGPEQGREKKGAVKL